MGAGGRGGHDRDGGHPREGPGGLEEEEVPQPFALLGYGRSKDSGVLRDDRGMVRPADLDIQVLKAGRGQRMRREAGDDLPADRELIHGSLFSSNASCRRFGAHLDNGRTAAPDVGDDLIPEGEDCFLVEDLVLVDVDR